MRQYEPPFLPSLSPPLQYKVQKLREQMHCASIRFFSTLISLVVRIWYPGSLFVRLSVTDNVKRLRNIESSSWKYDIIANDTLGGKVYKHRAT